MEMIFSLLAGLCFGYVFLSVASALQPLMGLYEASYASMSVLLSALLWSHALMQVPGGMIADPLGLRRALWMSLVSIAVGNLSAAAFPNLHLAIAGRVLTGVGTGLGFVTIMKMIALHAPGGRVGMFQAFFGGSFYIAGQFAPPKSLATFLGFVNFLANLGAVLFTLIFGWVKDTTDSFSWAFAPLAAFSLTAFLLGSAPLRREVLGQDIGSDVAAFQAGDS
jgi:MFS family permease